MSITVVSDAPCRHSEIQMDRKMLPPEERRAIANCLLWIREDLRARGEDSTQAGIGQALGGISQPAIGKAMKRAEVGPVIRDAVLNYTGLTRDQLVGRHGEPSQSEQPDAELPPGTSIEGDALWWLRRVVGEDSGTYAKRAGIREKSVIALENEEYVRSSPYLKERIAKGLGVSFSRLQHYLEGGFGRPSEVSASRLLRLPTAGSIVSVSDWEVGRAFLESSLKELGLGRKQLSQLAGIEEEVFESWFETESRPYDFELANARQAVFSAKLAMKLPLGSASGTEIRYPERRLAVDLLVADGHDESVVAEAASRAAIALDAPSDLSVLAWVEMIRPFIKAARRGEAGKRIDEQEIEED